MNTNGGWGSLGGGTLKRTQASKEAIHRHPRRVKSFLLGPILSKERWNVAFVPSAGSGLVSASKGTWGAGGGEVG